MTLFIIEGAVAKSLTDFRQKMDRLNPHPVERVGFGRVVSMIPVLGPMIVNAWNRSRLRAIATEYADNPTGTAGHVLPQCCESFYRVLRIVVVPWKIKETLLHGKLIRSNAPTASVNLLSAATADYRVDEKEHTPEPCLPAFLNARK